MIREFAAIDVYYLLLAARWTLALTALAFVGGQAVNVAWTLLLAWLLFGGMAAG